MKGMVMKNFVKLLKDESGASAAEYALILAIVGTAIAAASITLGNTIGASMNTASTCISTKGATC
jgi:pilus assembly protein Flp/PilA